MKFRYFDAEGTQLTAEQLRALDLATPAMEHVFSTVAERVRRSGNPGEGLEQTPAR